jgi:hypothetical protein
VVNLEIPILLVLAGLTCALIAWLLGTFTQFLRAYRYRVTFGLIAFPLGGLMGFVSILNAVSSLGDWLASKSSAVMLTVGCCGYLLFGFLGCWTVVRLGGRMDRKHTLSVLYNLVRERKERDSQ